MNNDIILLLYILILNYKQFIRDDHRLSKKQIGCNKQKHCNNNCLNNLEMTYIISVHMFGQWNRWGSRMHLYIKQIMCCKNGLLHIVKLLKLVCVFAIGVVPIHDVATREKRLFGCERCICAFLPNSRSRSKIFHRTIASSVQPF